MAVHQISWETDDYVSAVNHKMHEAEFGFLDADASEDKWYITKFGVLRGELQLTRETMLWFGDVIAVPLFFALKGGLETEKQTLSFTLESVFCFAAVMFAESSE